MEEIFTYYSISMSSDPFLTKLQTRLTYFECPLFVRIAEFARNTSTMFAEFG